MLFKLTHCESTASIFRGLRPFNTFKNHWKERLWKKKKKTLLPFQYGRCTWSSNNREVFIKMTLSSLSALLFDIFLFWWFRLTRMNTPGTTWFPFPMYHKWLVYFYSKQKLRKGEKWNNLNLCIWLRYWGSRYIN